MKATVAHRVATSGCAHFLVGSCLCILAFVTAYKIVRWLDESRRGEADSSFGYVKETIQETDLHISVAPDLQTQVVGVGANHVVCSQNKVQ